MTTLLLIAAIATDAIDNDAIAASAVTEIQSGLATAASISALNNLSAAQVNSEVDTALADIHLDHLIAVADPGGVVANSSFLAKLVSKSATPAFSDFDNTTDALQALRDRGDAAWITSSLTAGGIADAVWDEARSGHTTAGTYGEFVPVPTLNHYGTMQAGSASQTAILASGASTTTWVCAKVTGWLLDVHRQIGGRGGVRSRIKFYSLDSIVESASGSDEHDDRSRLLHDHRQGRNIRQRRDNWRHMLRGFLPRERAVLLRRFCLRQTAAQIAACLRVSENYIEQVAAAAMARLRELEGREQRVTDVCA